MRIANGVKGRKGREAPALWVQVCHASLLIVQEGCEAELAGNTAVRLASPRRLAGTLSPVGCTGAGEARDDGVWAVASPGRELVGPNVSCPKV